MDISQSSLESFICNFKAILRASYIALPSKAEVKFYHHKGVDQIASVGAAFISVIQQDYCKFIVVMTPGQQYPSHYHRIKDESYFVVYGDLTVVIENEVHKLVKGDILRVPRRFTHSFSTEKGCVFEEISTAYLRNDSVYEDSGIQKATGSEKVSMSSVEALHLLEEERDKQQ